jgi:periplasmic protein TonB
MPSSSTSSEILARIRRDGRRPCDNTLLGYAPLRIAIGSTLALVVVVTLFRIPWEAAAPMQGWRLSPQQERIQLQQSPEEIIEKQDVEGGLITRFDAEPEETEAIEEEPEAEEVGDIPEPAIPEPTSHVADLRRLALYLNIYYPAEAARDNVSGRNVIQFVVEPDGSTSQIEVLQALHPACDSVAVNAIRHANFVPGRQNGELVRVKMRLPIRFLLRDPNRPAADTTRG